LIWTVTPLRLGTRAGSILPTLSLAWRVYPQIPAQIDVINKVLLNNGAAFAAPASAIEAFGVFRKKLLAQPRRVG
jgi:hypothetical protein